MIAGELRASRAGEPERVAVAAGASAVQIAQRGRAAGDRRRVARARLAVTDWRTRT
jgi:hypothetical protein